MRPYAALGRWEDGSPSPWGPVVEAEWDYGDVDFSSYIFFSSKNLQFHNNKNG